MAASFWLLMPGVERLHSLMEKRMEAQKDADEVGTDDDREDIDVDNKDTKLKEGDENEEND